MDMRPPAGVASVDPRAVGASVVDAIPVGVVVTNASGQITWCNAELPRQFGYTPNELLGQTIEVLLPERYRVHHGALRRGYQDAPAARPMGSGRVLFGLRKNGEEFPIEVGIRPLPGEGEPQIVATVVDISTRKRTEATLLQAIESAPFGVLMLDPQRRIMLVNLQLVGMFGYAREELIGRPLDILLPERHRGAHATQVSGYYENAASRPMGAGRELTGRHKSGNEFYVEIGLTPIQTEQGMCVKASVIDVTERHLAEHQLRTAHAALEEFAYVVAHDLRSPLHGLSDLAEWIEQDLGDSIPEKVQAHIRRMRDRTERFGQLIDSLLQYAKSGSEEAPSQVPDVREWLRRCAEFVASPPHVRFIIDSDVDDARFPTTPVGTVLRNLIANAVVHNDKTQPQIELHARRQGAYLIFAVADNGPGIPEASRQRVFQLFQRLSRDKPGSGMGLALARRIVNAHGGSIELGERPDGQTGAVFTVKWPNFRRSEHRA